MKSRNSVPELRDKYQRDSFPTQHQISKTEAKEKVDMLIACGQPVHPDFARALYNTAELPMPEHLIPKHVTLQPEELKRLEDALFGRT